MNKVVAWIADIAVSAGVAFLVTVIVNTLIGFGIENATFGNATQFVSEAWPELMMPAAVLLAIIIAVDHRPE